MCRNLPSSIIDQHTWLVIKCGRQGAMCLGHRAGSLAWNRLFYSFPACDLIAVRTAHSYLPFSSRVHVLQGAQSLCAKPFCSSHAMLVCSTCYLRMISYSGYATHEMLCVLCCICFALLLSAREAMCCATHACHIHDATPAMLCYTQPLSARPTRSQGHPAPEHKTIVLCYTRVPHTLCCT